MGNILSRRPVYFAVLFILLLPAATVLSQNPIAPTFRGETNLVVVDVVARDSKGSPVALKGSDLRVFEDGKERTLESFEHSVTSQPVPMPATLERPGWFNNRVLRTAANRDSCIFVLDTLNTPFNDQQRAKKYLLSAIDHMPTSRRCAVFILGMSLVQLTAFTDDLKVLRAAVLSAHAGTNSFLGPDLLTARNLSGELTPLQSPVLELGDPMANAQSMLADVIGWQLVIQKDREHDIISSRVALTLDALDAIARVTATNPARKSLIWISAAFPVSLDPEDASKQISRNYGAQFSNADIYAARIIRTSQKLAQQRIAVYPIDIRGLVAYSDAGSTNSLYDHGKMASIYEGAFAARDASYGTMATLAEETGGRATFNTNDIDRAITKMVDDGADYYTVSFKPTHLDDGKPHRIELKTNSRGVHLQYRHSFIALKNQSKLHSVRMLGAALSAGQSPATEIEITGLATVGREGTFIEMAVSPRDLELIDLPDGRKRAQLTVAYVAYSLDSKTPVRDSAPATITFDDKQFQSAMKAGVPLPMTARLPAGKWYIYGGIYDESSGRLGTVLLSVTVGELVLTH
jgi:VWFA-related protein